MVALKEITSSLRHSIETINIYLVIEASLIRFSFTPVRVLRRCGVAISLLKSNFINYGRKYPRRMEHSTNTSAYDYFELFRRE